MSKKLCALVIMLLISGSVCNAKWIEKTFSQQAPITSYQVCVAVVKEKAPILEIVGFITQQQFEAFTNKVRSGSLTKEESGLLDFTYAPFVIMVDENGAIVIKTASQIMDKGFQFVSNGGEQEAGIYFELKEIVQK